MISSSKESKIIFILLFLIIITITAGGILISKDRAVDIVKNKTIFEVATPHFGPLIRTTPISVTYTDNKASANIKPEQAKLIAPRQNVILFDQNQNILPLGGSVHTLEKDKVTISLPIGTNTDLLSKEVHIIYLETSASKRLPISALQNDAENNLYIWQVSAPDEKESLLKKIYLNNILMAEPLFDPLNKNILAYHHFVLNPDDSLNTEKPVLIEKVDIVAPIQNPIEEARAAFQKLLKQKDYEDMRITAENCGKEPANDNQQAPAENNAQGCGLDISNMPEEFQLFYSLIDNADKTGN